MKLNLESPNFIKIHVNKSPFIYFYQFFLWAWLQKKVLLFLSMNLMVAKNNKFKVMMISFN